MAYLHCHKCDWGQDDFWSKDGYNPFRQDFIEDMKHHLFEDKVYGDKFMFVEMNLVPKRDTKGWYCDSRKFVAAQLERKAAQICNMAVKTYEEWEKVKDNFVCPECGHACWDID